jgi:hypothetical protein
MLGRAPGRRNSRRNLVETRRRVDAGARSNGKEESYCFLRIHAVSGRKSLVFLPQPQGGTRVSFPLKDSFGGKLIFENKEHDFPQRVIYERKDPGLLLAAIEGTYKGKEEREEFQMRKVRCNPKDE